MAEQPAGLEPRDKGRLGRLSDPTGRNVSEARAGLEVTMRMPTAIEKGASSILMPTSSRRQLNDLPDDLAAKITIHYYLDARDALLKALGI